MTKFTTLLLAALLCACGNSNAQHPPGNHGNHGNVYPHQGPQPPINPPDFWGDNHPEDTHNHTNGNGHNGGHHGWGHGHHKPKHKPNDPGCEPGGGGGAPVPEPGTMLLFGSGLVGAALMRRRKNKAEAETAEQNAQV